MIRAWLVALVCSCYTGPTPATDPPPAPPPPPSRPATFRVAGHWSYWVRTNECNGGTGTGAVDFTPHGDDTYEEAGYVVWPDGSRIEWNGEMQLSFESMQSNSLDDTVASRWFVDRERDQLVVRWRQSNGCSGIGIASRQTVAPSFATLSWCARCESTGSGCAREDGRRCPALCCR